MPTSNSICNQESVARDDVVRAEGRVTIPVPATAVHPQLRDRSADATTAATHYGQLPHVRAAVQPRPTTGATTPATTTASAATAAVATATTGTATKPIEPTRHTEEAELPVT